MSQEAHGPHPHTGNAGHTSAGSQLSQSEGRLEGLIKGDPEHNHMSEVYKELDDLRQKDGRNFRHDLTAINKKLHKDGLLPNISIVQDQYTGADNKTHVGYSLIQSDPNNKGGRVGAEVSTSHPQVPDTPASQSFYQHMHGRSGLNSGSYSAEGGRAAGGGFDSMNAGNVIPKGEHKELIDKALEMAGIPVNAQTEAAMNKIITRESGWNSNIVNTWDSNARRGDPSKGLMQVIHSTFERFRDKSLPDSQTDPVANMVAALHYMGHTYGRGNATRGLLRVASRSGGY